jgi:hypothetical protein
VLIDIARLCYSVGYGQRERARRTRRVEFPRGASGSHREGQDRGRRGKQVREGPPDGSGRGPLAGARAEGNTTQGQNIAMSGLAEVPVTKQNISRDSHYVPQSTLRKWSEDGERIHAYRTLVSHPNVPEWSLRAIKNTAYQRDLYTTFNGDQELDEFELWIGREFEEPGLQAVDKLLSGTRLTQLDWKCLVRFVAAQDVRTPLNFMESMLRWDQEMPDIFDKTIKDSIRKLQAAKERGIMLNPANKPNEFSDLVTVKISPPVDPTSDEASVRAEVTLGRRLWIASMRHLLTGAANVLCQHRWSVVEPHGSEEWLLTDHPVLRLNYYEPGHYDFCGGWNNPGSEIMMPVSPRHLLYVRVGEKALNRFSFSPEQTLLVQKLFVERAHRWIFSRQPLSWVADLKPRSVSAEQVQSEQNAWKQWHGDQLRAEKGI